MMRRLLCLLALAALWPVCALADVVLASRTLRAGTLIEAADLVLSDAPDIAGSAIHPDEVIGHEARVTLYAGRPIPLANLAPPALVERNASVVLVFRRGGLDIRTGGRALGRGAEGDEVRVMNLASRNTVTGIVFGPGLVRVN